MLALVEEVFPSQVQMALQYTGLGYVYEDEARLTKWLCQVIGNDDYVNVLHDTIGVMSMAQCNRGLSEIR